MLVYDTETSVTGNKPDGNKDVLRTISMYEIEQDKWYFYTYKQIREIQTVFNKHRVIIGHNIKVYDNPVLIRAGISLRYHLVLDTLEIVRKRSSNTSAPLSFLLYESKALSNLAKVLKLEHYKDEDFDYDILSKPDWTKEELEYIKTYNDLDVQVTLELFNYLKNFFEPYKAFLKDTDIKNFSWLKSAMSVYAYKVICNFAGIIEEYDDNSVHKKFSGGWVTEPEVEQEHDNIFCLDYASLYIHIYIMCNLYSPSVEGWNGDGFFKTYGSFNNKKQGRIEQAIHKIYDLRKKLKQQGDPREKALKCVLVILWGITGNPTFKNVYDYDSASSCTSIAQKCIKYAREVFEDYGYKFLYTDTDSVYIKDPFKNRKKLLLVKNIIISDIKSHVPFPVDTFDMDIDYEIDHIWFFNNGDKVLKKCYMFVTTNKELVVKGLPLKKSDSSGIGYHIFNKYMRKDVINGNIVFDYDKVKYWVKTELNNDISIVLRTFKVMKASAYKNESQLQSQISKKYGYGKHELITNNVFGVGKGKRYCTIKEFREQGLTIDNIDLSKMWSELKHFTTIPVTVKVKNQRLINKNQKTLFEWGKT